MPEPIKILTLEAYRMESLEDYDGYGIRLVAGLDDGTTATVPIIWSAKDCARQTTPAQTSALFQSLFQNGIDTLMDVLEFPNAR